jgi:two-component system CheB/CheR fusion protein
MQTENKKMPIIVGLGSSAGGLEALRLFLSNVPAERGDIAYVVVQHLSPNHKSMMLELLSRETPFDVLDVKSGLLPKANTIYITPPDRDVTLVNGLFHLDKPSENRIGPKPSIDKFFISLAQEQGERAVGVVLSGTGSDGSQGLRAIRAEGGITIAQKPEEAKFDGMPMAAIQTKGVDYVLSAEEMGQEIIHLLRNPRSLRVEKAEESEMQSILTSLQERIGVDFSQYKKSTITRRIERRMAAIKSATLKEYSAYLKENSDEVDLLYRDMLIGVTDFFRDKEAFEALGERLQDYIQAQPIGDSFRVWVTACSTGEEAYSIAILLDEIMGARTATHIKIFATDIDEVSIKKAREGVYPEIVISNMSKERLKRYFTQRGNEVEVKPFLKERVIFSRHNIMSDPPFVNLDLLSCRNLLIYFENDLQKRIFTTFAYALKTNALMFLGKSETVSASSDYFATIDAKNKVFQARTTNESRKLLYPQMISRGKYVRPTQIAAKRQMGTIEDAIRQTLFDFYDDKCAVIDNDFNVHYIKGNLNGLLSLPSGLVHNNILKMLPDGLSLEVRSLVYKANKDDTEHVFPLIAERVEANQRIKIKLSPLENYHGNYLMFLLSFELDSIKTQAQIISAEHVNDDRMQHLEQELMTTREHLQTVVEELETSNEELQASNEELQASNEELQASNEELETTNEELQSTNEELQTAYAEIRALYEKQNIQKNHLADRAEELSILRNELDVQYHFVKQVLDAEKNIVLVTDGKSLISANQAFLNFFNDYKNLEDFKKEHTCICEFFEKIDEDSFIYDKKDGASWLQLIVNSDRTDLKVRINRPYGMQTFHIMANILNGDEKVYVVTLSNISAIDATKQKLRQALSEEIQHKVSSSRILNQFSSIFGMDVFVRELMGQIKHSLNGINRLYHQMIETLPDSSDNHNYLQLFHQNKEAVLADLQLLKDMFSSHNEETINPFSTIEKVALLLGQSKSFPVEIEVIGNQEIVYFDKHGQFLQFSLLWMMLFVRIAQQSGLKSLNLKVEVQKVFGKLVIKIVFSSLQKMGFELMQLDSLLSDRFHEYAPLEDAYYVCKALIEETYSGSFKLSADDCEIILGG